MKKFIVINNETNTVHPQQYNESSTANEVAMELAKQTNQEHSVAMVVTNINPKEKTVIHYER